MPDNYGTFRPPEVSVLPSPGNLGRIVCLSTDGHIYADNGTSWDDLSASESASVDDLTIEIVAGELRVKDSGISLEKMADLPANTIIGNNTGGPDVPLALTAGQVRTLIGLDSDDTVVFGTVNADKIGVGLPNNTSAPVRVAAPYYSTGTASQSGNTITGSGTVWTATAIGKLFVFADGTTRTITGRSSNTSLTVAESGTVSSQAYGIYHQGFCVTDTGDVGIGASVIPTGARVFVLGGDNGANFDLRARIGSADQAILELQDHDFDSTFVSTYLVNYGVGVAGTTAGITNNGLGALVFQGKDNALIATTGGAPIIFAPDFSEKMRLSADGDLTLSGDLGLTGNRIAKGWFTNLEVTNPIVGNLVITASGNLSSTNAQAAFEELQGDIDAINSSLGGLTDIVTLKGLWDASAGTFPGAGSAQAGWSYIVSVAGTVDGVPFDVNDRVLAIADNASTSTYAANWHKLDYTDQVLSVNGLTGAVSLDQDDIGDGTTYKQYSATEKSKLAGIAAGATANSADSFLLDRANHTGSQAQSTITGLVADLADKQPLDADLTTIAGLTATTGNFMIAEASAWASRTPAQARTTLNVADGATANSSDATLLNRANHTGTQAQSTITNLVTDLSNKQPLDSDLTTIAGLTATTNNFIVSVSSAWASRTPAQVRTTLNVADGATANSSDATLLNRANHTGTQSADTLTNGTSNKVFTTAEQTKLSGIAAGATANSSDATLLNRANHTGSQAQSTITNLVTDLSNKQPLDSDLTTIAGLTATTDNFIVSVSSAWASRTPAQVRTTLNVADGATANSSDATLLNRANHTGSQAQSTITNLVTDLSNKQPLDADLTTIAGLTATTGNFMIAEASAWASRTPAQARTTLNVANGATANSADATLLARANHTGTQAESTISFTDITTGNASTSAHGFLRKLSNDANQVLNGQGNWVSAPAPSSVYLDNTGLKVKDTNASHGLIFKPNSDLSADRTLNFVTGDVDATLTVPKRYVALVEFTGTGVSVAVVFENTLGGTPTWARSTTGQYTATLSGAFTSNKTALRVIPSYNSLWINSSFIPLMPISEHTSTSSVKILWAPIKISGSDVYVDVFSPADMDGGSALIEILVYP